MDLKPGATEANLTLDEPGSSSTALESGSVGADLMAKVLRTAHMLTQA